MKSLIDFEKMIIDDLFLDQTAVHILDKIQTILSRLELHELKSLLDRDTGIQIELSKLIDDTNNLKQRYLENIKEGVDLKVKTLEEK